MTANSSEADSRRPTFYLLATIFTRECPTKAIHRVESKKCEPSTAGKMIENFDSTVAGERKRSRAKIDGEWIAFKMDIVFSWLWQWGSREFTEFFYLSTRHHPAWSGEKDSKNRAILVSSKNLYKYCLRKMCLKSNKWKFCDNNSFFWIFSGMFLWSFSRLYKTLCTWNEHENMKEVNNLLRVQKLWNVQEIWNDGDIWKLFRRIQCVEWRKKWQ